MALIDLQYKGLTGVYGILTNVDNTDTLDELITVIASDEGLDTNYYQISKQGDPADTFSATYGDSSTTLADVGIENGDRIICTTNQAGTKQARQIQKLEIAAIKRGESYDINLLPNPYNGNISDPDDGDPGPLNDRRPWI